MKVGDLVIATSFHPHDGLVERLGIPIHLVETTRFNFKITTPEDLEIAEIILSQRKDN